MDEQRNQEEHENGDQQEQHEPSNNNDSSRIHFNMPSPPTSSQHSSTDFANMKQLIETQQWQLAMQYLLTPTQFIPTATKKTLLLNSSKYCADGGCLHSAIRKRAPVYLVRKLLEIGSKELVCQIQSSCGTALHMACLYRSGIRVMELLVETGGDDLVLMRDNDGYTALHWLCVYINNDHKRAFQKVRLLLGRHGSKRGKKLLAMRGNDGKTPVDIAVRWGARNVNLVYYLITRNPKVLKNNLNLTYLLLRKDLSRVYRAADALHTGNDDDDNSGDGQTMQHGAQKVERHGHGKTGDC